MQVINYQYMLPMNVGTIISSDNEVFLIERILSLLDLSKLYPNKKKSKAGRSLKICKERLLMILIYAYTEGVFSSRDISDKLKRDINYMYLAENKQLSHDKINKFRQSLKNGVFLDIFKQFVIMLSVIKEIEFNAVYIDGTKLEANANRYSFVWQKAVSKNEVKLQVNVKTLINKINEELDFTFKIDEEGKITIQYMSFILNELNRYVKKNKIEITNGKGKRKSNVQKYIDELEDYLTRQSKYDFANSVFDGRNSYSKSDLDATFMRMKDDHMKNGQLKAAYNVQVAIEGDYVVGLGIFNNRNDINTLIPLLEKMYNQYGLNFRKIIADSGYFSELNISYIDSIKATHYIPYQSYYMEQTRKFKLDISKKENMIYDKEKNMFICANNHELKYSGLTVDNSNPKYSIEKLNYKAQGCEGCPLRNKCMPRSNKNHTNKSITFSEVYEKQKKQALENIKSEEGILLRINRSIQVEGFFGILKQNYNFRRFMLRGIENVELEMLLLAFGHNIRKLHKKIKTNKVGTVTLYKLKDKEVAA